MTPSASCTTRRRFLYRAGSTLAVGMTSPALLRAEKRPVNPLGYVVGEPGVEEVGTTVDLVLNFPDLDASIAVSGEVVWANREPPMDMGIRFFDLDEERKDTLRKYINMVRK